jgi:hypothetical protein
LAGKSTLNRLELSAREKAENDRYHKLDWDGIAIREFFVDAFISSNETPPAEIVLDFNATDDPVHGGQGRSRGIYADARLPGQQDPRSLARHEDHRAGRLRFLPR